MEDGKDMAERELVRKVTIRNIPESWKRDVTLQGGNKFQTLEDAKKALMKIERTYDFEPQKSCKKMRKTPSDNGNKNGDKTDTSSSGKKQCRLQGHDHVWKDCPNTLYSSSFTGTQFSVIRDCERAAAHEANLEDKTQANGTCGAGSSSGTGYSGSPNRTSDVGSSSGTGSTGSSSGNSGARSSRGTGGVDNSSSPGSVGSPRGTGSADSSSGNGSMGSSSGTNNTGSRSRFGNASSSTPHSNSFFSRWSRQLNQITQPTLRSVFYQSFVLMSRFQTQQHDQHLLSRDHFPICDQQKYKCTKKTNYTTNKNAKTNHMTNLFPHCTTQNRPTTRPTFFEC